MGNYYTPYPVRIEEELLDRIKEIAKIEKRSINKQIEYILEMYVENYEDTLPPTPRKPSK